MNKPKLLTTKMAEAFDLIVTMGCSDQKSCQAPLLKNVIDWGLEDQKTSLLKKPDKSETK
jgi:protein-tyrosine-phosphatase